MKKFLQATSGQYVAGQLVARSAALNAADHLLAVSSQQHFLHAHRAVCPKSIRAFSQTPTNRFSLSNSSFSASDNGANQKKSGFWSSITGRDNNNKSNESKSKSGGAGKGRKEKAAPSPRAAESHRQSGKQERRAETRSTSDKERKKAANTIPAGGGRNKQVGLDDANKHQTRNSFPSKEANNHHQQPLTRDNTESRGNNMELRSAKQGKTKASPSEHHHEQQQKQKQTGNVSAMTGKRSAANKSSKRHNSKDDDYTTKTDSTHVTHDEKAHRFILDLGNGQVARIDYRLLNGNKGDKTIELYHTEVPEELRGRGIARALARGALEQAHKANLRCKLTCSYLVDYLKRFAGDSERKAVIDS